VAVVNSAAAAVAVVVAAVVATNSAKTDFQNGPETPGRFSFVLV
jgi:hypothetical protein